MQINPVTRTVGRLRAAALCRKSPSTMPPLPRTKNRSRKQTKRYNGNSRSRPSTNTAATVLARPLRPEPLKGQRRREPTAFTRQAAHDGAAVDCGALKGDVLIVMRLDRPVRSTRDLRNILDTVAKTGAPLSGSFQIPVPRSAERRPQRHWRGQDGTGGRTDKRQRESL
jgi:hypothetical protein